MAAQGLQVVLGGSGGIGGALVRELAARDLEVRAVSRHAAGSAPPGVGKHTADVANPAAAAAACRGAAVVYHCLQPPYHRWAEEFPPLNRSVRDAVAREGAKLVVADNLYMYGPILGPISEGSPQEPASRKGGIRKESADTLLAAHAAGRLRVTIGRASDYYGPGGRNSVTGETVFEAALAGGAVRWPASADQLRSFSYLPDLARALVTLGQSEAADGRAWIIPSAPPLTARALVTLIERELQRDVKLVVTSKLSMRVAGLFIPQARELPDIWYQFAAPFVADGSAFETEFGSFDPTAHDQAGARDRRLVRCPGAPSRRRILTR
jgi:nucleoside-diphosphate-sugar epimerase